MSSSWTERQGQVGDLRNHSREELQDLLLRQEKILANKRLVQTLPDKGEKIQEFVEKVRLAIKHRDEEERRQSLAFGARSELQSKYLQAFTMQQRPAASHQEGHSGEAEGDGKGSAVKADVQEASGMDVQLGPFVSSAAAGEAAPGASVNSADAKEGDLVEALGRVRLSEGSAGRGSTQQSNSSGPDNYFLKTQLPQKAHYVTVLEKTEKSPAPSKQKFKPNQLLQRSDPSTSGSSPPGRSSEGSSLLSAQARRERDRKHLDDVTAAKLPPLHHSPAKLLTLEQSAALLREQTKKHQELQAKLAAQKLSEGLKIAMGSFAPAGSPMAAYREVHDEGAQFSSEED